MAKDTNMLADIYKYPDNRLENPQGAKSVTIGDIHGNFMKLLHFLITSGVADLPKKQYEELADIYRRLNIKESYLNLKLPRPSLTDYMKANQQNFKNDIRQFKQILFNLQFIDAEKAPLIRIIGDELADRGSNDYFTLKLFEIMQEHQLPMEILFSNHSAEYLLRGFNVLMDNKGLNQTKSPIDTIITGQDDSLQNMAILIGHDLLDENDVAQIVGTTKAYYIPNLKIVSHEVDDINKTIRIHSHAKIGLSTILELHEQLKQIGKGKDVYSAGEFNPRKIEKLKLKDFEKMMDMINSNFINNLDQIKVEKSNNKNGIMSAIEKTIWSREYPGEMLNSNSPKMIDGYKIEFVHGHDQDLVLKKEQLNAPDISPQAKLLYENQEKANLNNSIINLDNDNLLGKFNPKQTIPDNNVGNLHFAISSDQSLQFKKTNLAQVSQTAGIKRRNAIGRSNPKVLVKKQATSNLNAQGFFGKKENVKKEQEPDKTHTIKRKNT